MDWDMFCLFREKSGIKMYFLFMLMLTLGAAVSAQSGKDVKTRDGDLRSFFKQIEMKKRQLSRDGTFGEDEIKYRLNETKEGLSALDNNIVSSIGRNNYLSRDAIAANKSAAGSSNNKRVTNNITNRQNTSFITIAPPYNPTEKEETEKVKDKENDCNIQVAKRSIQYFQSQLLTNEPHFVQFRIRLTGNTNNNSTKDVFQGERWYWTYNTSSGPFPFLSWNLDYGLLTFGLLDAKTIHIPYVCLNVTSDCRVTYGSNLTSFQITEALTSLVNFTELKHDYIRYRESYFCYLFTKDNLRGTFRYYAALYIIYPFHFIRYKCCTVNFNYTSQKLYHSCPEGKIPGTHTWTQTSHMPFLLGMLLLAFCPITMFKLFAWTAEDDRIVGNNVFEQDAETSVEGFQLIEDEDNWIYADGIKSPVTFCDLFSFNVFGLYDTYPILASRLRRLICLVFTPSIIYIQIAWYRNGLGVWDDGDKITVKDLVEVGTPMGFLSILDDSGNKYKTFVPGLGGPLVIAIIYFTFGFLFFVLPRCLKQIVEDGLPNSNLYIPSPLFFGYKEIVKMSKIKVDPEKLEPGYTKGTTLMKCSFYLLFTTKFWICVWRIQTRRISCYGERTTFCLRALAILVLPIYVVFCILEVIMCLLYYGLPFCFFVVVMVKGATKALGYLRDQGRFLSRVFSFKIFIAVGVTLLFIMFSLLAYVVGLVFIKSFGLVTQVITLCFIAVIIYPSVSFGYLFFFVIVLYYFIKQIRNFSDGYTDLLSTAVDISKAIAQEPYNVTLLDGYLTISNVNCESLKGVRINGETLDTKQVLPMNQSTRRPLKIRKKNHVFGVPRRLFDFLVKTHRPVHQQVLALVFRVSIMIAFIYLTLSISSNYVSGPTTEISEVMHVIFIVVVGVIPQLIGVAFDNSKSVLVREIEERKIEQLITEYWSLK